MIHARDGAARLPGVREGRQPVHPQHLARLPQPDAARRRRADRPGAAVASGAACSAWTSERRELAVEVDGARTERVEAAVVYGTDGAGSAVRPRGGRGARGRVRRGAAGPRVQGADPARGPGRQLATGAERAPHLAARRLHADRPAQRGRELHLHPVPRLRGVARASSGLEAPGAVQGVLPASTSRTWSRCSPTSRRSSPATRPAPW